MATGSALTQERVSAVPRGNSRALDEILHAITGHSNSRAGILPAVFLGQPLMLARIAQ
jgi:hypothetical protein